MRIPSPDIPIAAIRIHCASLPCHHVCGQSPWLPSRLLLLGNVWELTDVHCPSSRPYHRRMTESRPHMLKHPPAALLVSM